MITAEKIEQIIRENVYTDDDIIWIMGIPEAAAAIAREIENDKYANLQQSMKIRLSDEQIRKPIYKEGDTNYPMNDRKDFFVQ